jgi:hypothetical protein
MNNSQFKIILDGKDAGHAGSETEARKLLGKMGCISPLKDFKDWQWGSDHIKGYVIRGDRHSFELIKESQA